MTEWIYTNCHCDADMKDATKTPKTPKTTSAERQAALRQRARALAHGLDDADIRSAPDTALLEALPIAFRMRQTVVVESVLVDLLRRLGVEVTVTRVKPKEAVETIPVTVTIIDPIPDIEAPAVTVTRADPVPAVETPAVETSDVTVTPDIEADTETPAPGTRDASILTMHRAGESKRSIARALGCSDGTVRNVLKRHAA